MRRISPLLLALLLAACASAAPPAVPAPLAETVPLSPVTPDPMVWQPGHWNWNGSGYEWVGGSWVLTAKAGRLWQPGYWREQDGQNQWVAPHWQP